MTDQPDGSTASVGKFGRLEVVPLRRAWTHEAAEFTPWLSKNLDLLSDALGIPLELVDTEVAVTRFSADILARDVSDESLVLIENQLEESDHTHLGQIMTYLAGLNAQKIVWVAPKFREAHISAVRWLNEHTVDPYAFFAVELKVVQIGGSPIAPVLDVIERPNGWERRIQERARNAQALTNAGEFRRNFWTHFLSKFPTESVHGRATADHSRWRMPPIDGFIVAQYLAKDGVGVFIRGGRGVASEETESRLINHKDKLSGRLSAPMGRNNLFFLKKLSIDTSDPANWDRMSSWLHETANQYTIALSTAAEAPF